MPRVFEKEGVRREMVEWLDEVEGWRRRLAGEEKDLLAEMLEADPGERIYAVRSWRIVSGRRGRLDP